MGQKLRHGAVPLRSVLQLTPLSLPQPPTSVRHSPPTHDTLQSLAALHGKSVSVQRERAQMQSLRVEHGIEQYLPPPGCGSQVVPYGAQSVLDEHGTPTLQTLGNGKRSTQSTPL